MVTLRFPREEWRETVAIIQLDGGFLWKGGESVWLRESGGKCLTRMLELASWAAEPVCSFRNKSGGPATALQPLSTHFFLLYCRSLLFHCLCLQLWLLDCDILFFPILEPIGLIQLNFRLAWRGMWDNLGTLSRAGFQSPAQCIITGRCKQSQNVASSAGVVGGAFTLQRISVEPGGDCGDSTWCLCSFGVQHRILMEVFSWDCYFPFSIQEVNPAAVRSWYPNPVWFCVIVS